MAAQHIHGSANAPNVEDIMALLDDCISDKEDLIKFIDSLICTSNPAILPAIHKMLLLLDSIFMRVVSNTQT